MYVSFMEHKDIKLYLFEGITEHGRKRKQWGVLYKETGKHKYSWSIYLLQYLTFLCVFIHVENVS